MQRITNKGWNRLRERKQPDKKHKDMAIVTMTIQSGGHKSGTILPHMLRTQPRKKRKRGAVIPFMSRSKQIT
uniref:Uncharacterized protein n=1 Tax=Acetobacter pasteurianus TaxID=438 RepID=A0A0S3JPZ4_ACEPA|nr:hypothetical protein [Acetobacter pasteurianus]ALR88462.1 hypothetical protein DB34_14980 [Acetobacter pasteurianus]